jgi:hypothetical protein
MALGSIENEINDGESHDYQSEAPHQHITNGRAAFRSARFQRGLYDLLLISLCHLSPLLTEANGRPSASTVAVGSCWISQDERALTLLVPIHMFERRHFFFGSQTGCRTNSLIAFPGSLLDHVGQSRSRRAVSGADL